MKIRQIILPSLLLSGATVSADIVAHFPMDVKKWRDYRCRQRTKIYS